MNWMQGRYTLRACWGPRREPPDMLAIRILRTVCALPAIHPDLASWFIYPDRDSELIDVPTENHALARIIANGVSREDDGSPDPTGGFFFHLVNEKVPTPRRVTVGVHAGSGSTVRMYTNTVRLLTAPLSTENDSLITASVMKKIMLTVASIWDVTWCSAAPWLLGPKRPQDRPDRPWFSQAWIALLSARFASVVTPPASILSERTPNGDLLMIATEERFDLDNPKHLAAALEIEDALATASALPWPQPG